MTTSKTGQQSKDLKTEATKKGQINIKPLKDSVASHFPSSSALTRTILAERDILDTDELLAKIETWLNLLEACLNDKNKTSHQNSQEATN